MGFFAMNEPHWALLRRQVPRQLLLSGLIEEIKKGTSEAKPYAALLARTLISSDQELRREFAQQIADATDDLETKSAGNRRVG